MKDRKESDSDSGRDCYSMNLMKHCIIFCSMSHAEDYNFYNTNYEGLIFRHFGYNLDCILHDMHSCKLSFTKEGITPHPALAPLLSKQQHRILAQQFQSPADSAPSPHPARTGLGHQGPRNNRLKAACFIRHSPKIHLLCDCSHPSSLSEA